MTKQRYFIKLAYNGTSYHGWQLQKGQVTVQGVINEALQRILRDDKINIIGCGRTDTGVHAREFYAHFDTKSFMEKDFDLAFKLNNYLPNDISIDRIVPIDGKAHARFDAVSRTYQYQITRKKNPFINEFAWYLHGDLDIELMNQGASILIDYKDFKSFSKANTQVKNHLCDIDEAQWSENGDLLVFTITANRFLRNMVRAIVGTLIDLGHHKIELEDLRRIIESRRRSNAGYSVPAKGLFLLSLEYPEVLL